MLEPDERVSLVAEYPGAEPFIRRILGTDEFVKDQEKYCIWVSSDEYQAAAAVPALRVRFDRTGAKRAESVKVPTKLLAQVPYRFGEVRYKPTESIIMPKVSSSRRDYIPVGYLGADTVINASAFGVYDAEPWVLAILTSRTHVAWTGAVGGRMREDYQYSNTIVYNNLPVPPLSVAMKEQLTLAALRVLDVREYHCERTLAELYDPDLMPADLRGAHAAVDALVDSIYSKKPYETDEQRLSDLFARYEAMIAAEASKGTRK
jgi:hypothetical protein